MYLLLFLLAFIGVSLLFFFILFIAVKIIYTKIAKRSILSFGYFKRIILFFVLICVSISGSYLVLSVWGYTPAILTGNKKLESLVRKDEKEIKRVEAFLDNYENLSITDIQIEISHLKAVFYSLKQNVDFYNSKIDDVTKEYIRKKMSADSLSRSADSLSLISQAQFNIVFAEMDKRNKRDSIKAFFLGVVVSLIINLISSYIFEKMKRQ